MKSTHTITIDDKNYPERLKQINNPPEQLYVSSLVIPRSLKGDEESQSNNDQPPIISDTEYPLAVVGTRKVSPYGKQVTEYFVRSLVQRGMTIISGLALGIDGLAHKTTLEAGGRTIAVLGSGLDTIFPAVHKKLARDIVDSGGAVITEYPPEVPARRAYFPQRNRIISGLSLGVLVVEAPKKSGALITAA
ncbi:DNA-protecting protein DprA, partial [Patescibacteria group bacterium AH-259-L05]|nr:DNA-protecting protein DprA [Patescibacteria group bacterium AH-259-L05]